MSKDLKEGLIDKIRDYGEDTALHCNRAQGHFEIAHTEFLVYLGHREEGHCDKAYKCRSRKEAYHLLDRYHKDTQKSARAYDEDNDSYNRRRDYDGMIRERRVPFEWDISIDQLNSSDLLHLLVELKETYSARQKHEQREIKRLREMGA